MIHSTQKEPQESVFTHEPTGHETPRPEKVEHLLRSGAVRTCVSLPLFPAQTRRLTHSDCAQCLMMPRVVPDTCEQRGIIITSSVCQVNSAGGPPSSPSPKRSCRDKV